MTYETYETWQEQFIPTTWNSVRTEDEFDMNISSIQRFPKKTPQGDNIFKIYFGFDINRNINKDNLRVGTGAYNAWRKVQEGQVGDIREEALDRIRKIRTSQEMREFITDLQQGEERYDVLPSRTRESLVKIASGYDPFLKMRRPEKESMLLPVSEKIAGTRRILDRLEQEKDILKREGIWDQQRRNAYYIIKTKYGWDGTRDFEKAEEKYNRLIEEKQKAKKFKRVARESLISPEMGIPGLTDAEIEVLEGRRR